jgi:hypothetical protein
MWWMWLSVALAGGFYHPDDVSGLSARFAQAGEVAAPRFEERSRAAEALAAALNNYEKSLDLLGSAAPAAERERLAALRVDYNRQFAVLDHFSTTMMNDFDGEFRAALARALKAHAGAAECRAMIPAGRALPGMRANLKPNPACVGTNLNEALAKAMDADPQLSRAINEINAVRWPDMKLDAAPQTAIGGDARWIWVGDLLQRGASGALRDIDRADAEAREPFAAAIEQGVSVAEKKKWVDDAAAVTAATAKKRAAIGEPVVAAARGVLDKWSKKGEPATGFCANPTLLGGCAGADASATLVPRLLDEKKVIQALP